MYLSQPEKIRHADERFRGAMQSLRSTQVNIMQIGKEEHLNAAHHGGQAAHFAALMHQVDGLAAIRLMVQN